VENSYAGLKGRTQKHNHLEGRNLLPWLGRRSSVEDAAEDGQVAINKES
jgi:hypothetical protein